MSVRRLSCASLRALAALGAGIALAPSAFADEREAFGAGLAHVDPSAHPGAVIATYVAIVAACALAAAGVGCAIALVGAVVPRLRDAVDASARAAPAGRTWLVGCLTLGAVLLGTAAAAKTGVDAVALVAGIVLGAPALLLLVLGALGGIPLLGERLLGSGGSTASPLRRCVTATLALGVGAFPAVVPPLAPLALLVALVALGWPLGVGVEWAARLLRR